MLAHKTARPQRLSNIHLSVVASFLFEQSERLVVFTEHVVGAGDPDCVVTQICERWSQSWLRDGGGKGGQKVGRLTCDGVVDDLRE